MSRGAARFRKAAARLMVGVTAALVGMLVGVAPAAAQGVDETCVLALAKFDSATINVAFPDDSAQYYGGGFVLIPGVRIRITGRFPHARYMSFNVYDAQLRPVDAINDVSVTPDAGSSNPFVTGADRTVEQRSYTLFVEGGDPPARRAPNTLYSGQANPAGLFLYRIYVPDRGRNETGDTGLPTVTIEQSGAATARPAASPCTNFVKPGINGVNELLAGLSPPVDPPLNGGTNPPTWRKFVNLVSALAVNALGGPSPGGIDLDKLGGSGGFLSNRDNAYVSASVNRRFGPISVSRLRVPTFADTRDGAAVMPAGQLRYWSVCTNDPITQRFVGCVNDDRTVVTDGGFATFVVSTPAKRPPGATAKCGVNWLPWGVNPRNVLIYRHMLPDAAFAQSVQSAVVDREAATMGDYLPASRYYADAAAYDKAVGCPGPAKVQAAAAAKRLVCRSRRVVTLSLPKRLRTGTATIRIAQRTDRRVRIHKGKLRADLRRAPRARFTLRVVVKGRTVLVRRYSACP